MIDKEEIRNAYPVQAAWLDEGFPKPRSWRNCNSPFRDDSHPSFSVFDDGRKWKDHGTNDSGDVFDFIAKANYCEFKKSHEIILTRLGRVKWAGKKVQRQPSMDRKPLRLPPMHPGTLSDINTLALSRNLSIESVTWASDYRLLSFTHLQDNGGSYRAYVLTDSSRRNAQARRLDGECWQYVPSKPKVKTLPGSEASWPIGAANIGDKSHVVFCEGGPDFLTAIHFARNEGKEMDVAPVFMAGAALNIHPEALKLFKGKKIKIFQHLDDVGIKAALKWSNQLYSAGASEVTGFDFNGLTQSNGKPVRDLNDLAYQDVDCWEKNSQSHELFNFN